MLAAHAPELVVHTVLADATSAAKGRAELEHVVAALGARLVLDDVAEEPGTPRHDPAKLAAAYARILAGG